MKSLSLKQITPTPPFVVECPEEFIKGVNENASKGSVKKAWKKCKELTKDEKE